MPSYEHVFLARQDLSQAQVDALAEAAVKIVEDHQGKIARTETWGLKQLAYKIEKNRKAHFVMLAMDAPGETVAELERQASINEDIIRYLTIRVDAHENQPSIMMRKQERREGRGEGREGREGRPDRGDRPRRDRDADEG